MSEPLHTASFDETINAVLAACGLPVDGDKSPFTPPFTDEWDPFWEKISATDAAADALKRFNKYSTQKHAILRRFFSDDLDMVQKGTDIVLLHRKTGAQMGTQSELPFIIEELRLTRQEAYIRGRVKVLSGARKEDVSVHACINGNETPCLMLPDDPSDYKKDVLKCLAVSFEHRIPRKQLQKGLDIRFAVTVNAYRWTVDRLRFGDFAALGTAYNQQYYARYGWAFTRSKDALHLQPANLLRRLWLERCFLKELRANPSPLHQEAGKLRIGYFLRSLLPAKEIWLISDRYNKGDDNGEALFRHLCQHPLRKVQPYFVVSKDSPDYEQLKAVGPVVAPESPTFRKLLLRSRFFISSHADRFTVQPLGKDAEPYRDLLAGHQFIFLQHGITLSNISSTLNRTKQNMRIFVTAARPEHNSILQEPRYQCDQLARLTGLTRHDRLYHAPQKIVTIMPTWRKYLTLPQSSADEDHALVQDFINSDYFRFYNALLNHPRLLAAAKRNGYTVHFMPHPLVHGALHLFDRNEQVVFYPYDTRYRDVFAHSDLIMTDYSSAPVDFAYLRKPVVYCHFDKDEFTSGKHIWTPGYFDYETMGFGEVTYDLESLVDTLIAYMDSGCTMKPFYRQRADAFFAYSDQDNCKRVCEEIIKLRGEL